MTSNKILSRKFYDEMGKLEPRYPNKVALLLPALHAAQDETGWLPPEVLDEVAAYIGIHPAQVREMRSTTHGLAEIMSDGPQIGTSGTTCADACLGAPKIQQGVSEVGEVRAFHHPMNIVGLPRPTGAIPALGQHTAEVLSELGL